MGDSHCDLDPLTTWKYLQRLCISSRIPRHVVRGKCWSSVWHWFAR